MLRYRRMAADPQLARAIAHVATPLAGTPADFDPLLELAAGARFVLIGEASHGTHDFYRLRAELTKRLIREHGFCAIAAEADWPDAYRVNRYVRGGDEPDAEASLRGFERFPQWMWRNADVLDMVGWLRAHDETRARPARVGFYGLDLYSLHASMAAVLAYLDRVDPEAARRARARYACFDQFGEEAESYGRALALGLGETCEQEVVAQLVDLMRRRAEATRAAGLVDGDAAFEAEQNARVVAHAEEYYRQMYARGVSTWNLRDTHMADTLDALAAHLGPDARIVVWAHNSHVGDSAAMGWEREGIVREQRDEITLGHLCRERHPGETVLIGFSTYDGTVTAAHDWGEPAERMRVRPALPGSYEELFHATGVPGFLLRLDQLGEASGALHEWHLQRAIGVVYRPRTERASHYYHVRLPAQLDAIIHLDHTRALEPLERTALWDRGELPETYPTAL